MSLVIVYLASLFAFLAIDAVWLTRVMRPLFEKHVGPLLREDILLAPAAGFYAAYVAGVIYFCVLPALKAGGPGLAIVNGAILGFLAYGTYEATNMTTLKGWTWSMVVTDVVWGIFLTAITAAVGYYTAASLGISAAPE